MVNTDHIPARFHSRCSSSLMQETVITGQKKLNKKHAFLFYTNELDKCGRILLKPVFIRPDSKKYTPAKNFCQEEKKKRTGKSAFWEVQVSQQVITNIVKKIHKELLCIVHTCTVHVLNNVHALINAHPLFQLIYRNIFSRFTESFAFVTSYQWYQSSVLPLSRLINYFTKTLSLCIG